MTHYLQGAQGQPPVIREVSIQNFRCFTELTMADCARVNLIVGDNGAGKTALCEAMFLALCSDPAAAMKPRQWRGLPELFGGTSAQIGDAVWGSFFRNHDFSDPILIELRGSGPEARRLVMSRGASGGIVSLDVLSSDVAVQGPMAFEWTNNSGQTYRVEATFTAQGMQRVGPIEDLPSFYLYAAFAPVNSQEVADGFSTLSKRNAQKPFVEAIRSQYPWIEDLSVETAAGQAVLFAQVRNASVKLPLGEVSGAINRFAAIFLAMASRRGSLVIVDEIENGLHYSHHESMWSTLVAFARKMESQLFLTTHNEEWLEAVFSAADEDDLADVAFWRIQRDDGGAVGIKRFSSETIQAALETGNEVR